MEQSSSTTERLRAVSAVNADVAWASGNHGTIRRTTDGGRTWQTVQIPDASELDFRDIEALDAETAYVLSIGSGASSRIYATTDGGATWKAQFVNAEAAAFYDAIAFWDARHGLAFSDPVDGRFRVIRTVDAGRNWEVVSPKGMPAALPGESAFAASGTCLTVKGRKLAWIATGGGERARVLRTRDGGLTWEASTTPLIAGSNSTGIFSLAFYDRHQGIAVGGDYRKEAESNDNLARTMDGGRHWSAIGTTRLPAFRSAVAFLPGSKGHGLIAVGPQGSDLSLDGGASWTSLGGPQGLHALAVAGAARLVAAWAVGENGRIVRLELPKEDGP